MTAPAGARAKAALALVLLVGAGVAGVWSWRRVAAVRAEGAICEAAAGRDWPAALARSELLAQAGTLPPRAAECRCAALMETARRSECAELLEEILARPSADAWLPAPLLTAVAVEARRDRGELPAATSLAARGAARYPDAFVLHYLELDLRSRLEDEAQVLADLTARLPSAGEAAPLLALRLAERHIQRSEWDEALALCGTAPPARAELAGLWFRVRTVALAGAARAGELLATFAAWQEAGGDPVEIATRRALLLSMFQLADRERSTLSWMREAAALADRMPPDLALPFFVRYVGALRHAGAPDVEAVYREAVGRFGPLPALAPGGPPGPPEALLAGVSRTVRVRFRVDGGQPGDRLWATPPEGEVDAAYESLALDDDGTARTAARAGIAPLRWVLRDAAGRTRGSGSVWPAAATGSGAGSEVAVVRRPPADVPAAPAAARRPGDGRRRVVVALLDCGDWRLVQYLRTRGDLPVLDRLAREGLTAVLDSDPPYTAVALRAIAWPGRQGVDSFLGLVHQLGAEIEGLNFVGTNPAAGLSWVLPGEESLFTTLGAGPRMIANLLHSFGQVQVGRHAELTGPYGATRRVGGHRASRPLTAAERAAHPGVVASERRRRLLEEIAADLDTATALAAPGGPDLVMLRVAALDLMTHTTFAEVARAGQDDGDRALFAVYRYLDARLGELDAALDADDLLVVMSDHGIKTALEHDRGCLFVVAGGGVPRGRLPGRPAIAGVGRMLAELLGVETTWPATGLERWVATLPPASREDRR